MKITESRGKPHFYRQNSSYMEKHKLKTIKLINYLIKNNDIMKCMVHSMHNPTVHRPTAPTNLVLIQKVCGVTGIRGHVHVGGTQHPIQ